MNEVGFVLWHSLDKQGNVASYDVEWKSGIETDIPSALLEGVEEGNHQHETAEEGTQLSERKYKKR